MPATATATLTALDLFAGTGWGVACQRLGITEYGVDNAPAVIATRAANGMATPYTDVWEGLHDPAMVPEHDVLIASPPCQTFSIAGSGKGRAALDEVMRLVREWAFTRPDDLRAFAAEHGDDRTALVLAPLAYAWRFSPTYVVLEQVPTVQPVWDACAVELREWGYSVWTGVLHAEQYGVPQTRRRSVLIARADGVEAAPPVPTHSRYLPHAPERLEVGVLPWVSMGEALGWDDRDTAVKRMGAGMVERHGERPGRPADSPAFTIRANAGGMEPGGFRVLRSNYGTGGDPANRGERGADQPAPTITSKADRNKWTDGAEYRRLTLEEAAALQSYPAGFEWVGTRTSAFQQVGNAVPPLLAEAVLATLL